MHSAGSRISCLTYQYFGYQVSSKLAIHWCAGTASMQSWRVWGWGPVRDSIVCNAGGMASHSWNYGSADVKLWQGGCETMSLHVMPSHVAPSVDGWLAVAVAMWSDFCCSLQGGVKGSGRAQPPARGLPSQHRCPSRCSAGSR